MAMSTPRRKSSRPQGADFDSAWDPFRSDWLKLSPGQRIVRAWKLMKRVKNRQAAHDAASLPSL
jgi:hypothetical protein